MPRIDEDTLRTVTRVIFALKSTPPEGSQHYRSEWDDGVESALDAAARLAEEEN